MDLYKFEQRLEQVLIIILIAIFAMKIGLTFSQVIFRRIPEISIVWSEELARYSLIWLSFLGGALGLKKGVHVSVGAVVKQIPRRFQIYLEIFHYILVIFFSVFLLIWGTQLAIYNLDQTSPALGIPIGIIYAAIPISGVLLVFFSILEAIKIIRKPPSNDGETEEEYTRESLDSDKQSLDPETNSKGSEEAGDNSW